MITIKTDLLFQLNFLDGVYLRNTREIKPIELVILNLANEMDKITAYEVLFLTTLKLTMKDYIEQHFNELQTQGYLELSNDFDREIVCNNLERIRNDLFLNKNKHQNSESESNYDNKAITDSSMINTTQDYYLKISIKQLVGELNHVLSKPPYFLNQYRLTSKGRQGLEKKQIELSEKSKCILGMARIDSETDTSEYISLLFTPDINWNYSKAINIDSKLFSSLFQHVVSPSLIRIKKKDNRTFLGYSPDFSAEYINFKTKLTLLLKEKQFSTMNFSINKMYKRFDLVNILRSYQKTLLQSFYDPEDIIKKIKYQIQNQISFSDENDDFNLTNPYQFTDNVQFDKEFVKLYMCTNEQFEFCKKNYLSIMNNPRLIDNYQMELDSIVNIEFPLCCIPENVDIFKKIIQEITIPNRYPEENLISRNEVQKIIRENYSSLSRNGMEFSIDINKTSQEIVELLKKNDYSILEELLSNWARENSLISNLQQFKGYIRSNDEFFLVISTNSNDLERIAKENIHLLSKPINYPIENINTKQDELKFKILCIPDIIKEGKQRIFIQNFLILQYLYLILPKIKRKTNFNSIIELKDLKYEFKNIIFLFKKLESEYHIKTQIDLIEEIIGELTTYPNQTTNLLCEKLSEIDENIQILEVLYYNYKKQAEGILKRANIISSSFKMLSNNRIRNETGDISIYFEISLDSMEKFVKLQNFSPYFENNIQKSLISNQSEEICSELQFQITKVKYSRIIYGIIDDTKSQIEFRERYLSLFYSLFIIFIKESKMEYLSWNELKIEFQVYYKIYIDNLISLEITKKYRPFFESDINWRNLRHQVEKSGYKFFEYRVIDELQKTLSKKIPGFRVKLDVKKFHILNNEDKSKKCAFYELDQKLMKNLNKSPHKLKNFELPIKKGSVQLTYEISFRPNTLLDINEKSKFELSYLAEEFINYTTEEQETTWTINIFKTLLLKFLSDFNKIYKDYENISSKEKIIIRYIVEYFKINFEKYHSVSIIDWLVEKQLNLHPTILELRKLEILMDKPEYNYKNNQVIFYLSRKDFRSIKNIDVWRLIVDPNPLVIKSEKQYILEIIPRRSVKLFQLFYLVKYIIIESKYNKHDFNDNIFKQIDIKALNNYYSSKLKFLKERCKEFRGKYKFDFQMNPETLNEMKNALQKNIPY